MNPVFVRWHHGYKYVTIWFFFSHNIEDFVETNVGFIMIFGSPKNWQYLALRSTYLCLYFIVFRLYNAGSCEGKGVRGWPMMIQLFQVDFCQLRGRIMYISCISHLEKNVHEISPAQKFLSTSPLRNMKFGGPAPCLSTLLLCFHLSVRHTHFS